MVKMSVRGCTDIKEARCLHVQGVSHWAPANIGPYSQGYSLRSKIHVSGQIGLIPGTKISIRKFNTVCSKIIDTLSIAQKAV